MAISINPATYVITVPQADLTHIAGDLYELDVDWLRLQLKDWEDSEVGMIMPDTHNHNTEITLSGVTYARTFEVLAPYTVTFEYLGTPYTVRCVGANHNIADVKNSNPVSLIIGNSAGLISAAATADVVAALQADPPGLTSGQQTMLLELYRLMGLDPTRPLVVDNDSNRRRVPASGADIDQTVVTVGNVTTVTRQ